MEIQSFDDLCAVVREKKALIIHKPILRERLWNFLTTLSLPCLRNEAFTV